MSSNFHVCEGLKHSERCFYVRKYSEGKFKELCHEHVPKSRMSGDTALSALKALMVKHSGWVDSYALQAFMNKKGKNPPAAGELNVRVEYPGEGVCRKMCANSNLEGWVDEFV